MSDVSGVSDLDVSAGDVSAGGPAGGPAPVAAVVLCGGTSRRFGGVDKTAQVLGSATVLDSLLDALPPLKRTAGKGDEKGKAGKKKSAKRKAAAR